MPLLPGKAGARNQRLAVSNGARSRGTRTKGGVVSGVRSAQGGASRCRFKLVYFRPASGLNEELRRLHAVNLFAVVRQQLRPVACSGGRYYPPWSVFS